METDKIKSLEEKLTSEELEVFNDNVAKLGSVLHDEWRKPRLKEDGTYEPRMKDTKDEGWIKSHGTDKVDIANTNFEDLPSDWKYENRASAYVTMCLIYEAGMSGVEFDDNFVDIASSKLHDAWLERNGSWAPVEQKVSFDELSEEEKNKDRVIIRKGLEIVNDKENILSEKKQLPLEIKIKGKLLDGEKMKEIEEVDVNIFKEYLDWLEANYEIFVDENNPEKAVIVFLDGKEIMDNVVYSFAAHNPRLKTKYIIPPTFREDAVLKRVAASESMLRKEADGGDFKPGDIVRLTPEKIYELRGKGYMVGFPEIVGTVTGTAEELVVVDIGASSRLVVVRDVVHHTPKDFFERQ